MELGTIPVASALWLGVLTSISPCPLAANIAAVSYIVKGIDKTSTVLASGIAYTLGRAAAYAALGSLISLSLLNVPRVSNALQTVMPKILGPVLIVTGFFVLEVFSLSLPGVSFSPQFAEKLKRRGAAGTFVLGLLFALAFCPVSAALFFGSLIPLSIQQASPLALPLLYGIGTALPVLATALVVTFSAQRIGRLFSAVSKTAYWVKKGTAVVLIAVGVYYVLTYIFNIQVL